MMIILTVVLIVSVFLVLKSMQDVPGSGGTVAEKRNKEFKDASNIKQGREAETRPAERIQENVSEKSILEIAAEIMRTKGAEQRLKLLKELAKLKPETAEDIRAIVEVIHASGNEAEKEIALAALRNINETDKHLEQEFIRLLDDPDREVRTLAIVNLGKLKAVEAAPRLREIVKSFGKVDYLKFKTMRAVNMEEAYRMIFEPGAAAVALGEMKDEEAIPILVEKFEELEGYAAEGLSKMGKKGLPYLLELARKETDEESYYAHNALAEIKDIEAKPDLMNILVTERDREIRDRVLNALSRPGMFDDDVLELVKSLYEKEKDSLFLWAMKHEKATPFLIDVLKQNMHGNPRISHIVIGILGDIGGPSAVPALEKALTVRDRSVRQLSARALKKITGKDYDWKK
jgi:HEAT repeat protein